MSFDPIENRSQRIRVRPMDSQLPGAASGASDEPQSALPASPLYVPPPPETARAAQPRHESTRAYAAPRPMPVRAMTLRTPRPASEKPRRISQRRLLKHQRRLKTLARFVAIGMVSGSFFVGYKWTKQQAAHASSSPVHPESRQSALRLMDEAVRAKHEGRLKDALQAAADARRANPKVAGADVIAADIALVQRDAERSRAAAAQALELGQDVARAKLLLALSRLIPGGSRADAGEQPAVLLEEAGEAEFSDPDVRYVMSELLRASGREKEAREKLLGNLYRQEPWMSATIIAAKLQLAAFEANRAGEARARVVPTAAGDALVAAHGALRSGGDLLAPLRKLWASIAAHQVKEFLDDPLFDVPAPPSSLEEARKAQPPPIPYLAEE